MNLLALFAISRSDAAQALDHSPAAPEAKSLWPDLLRPRELMSRSPSSTRDERVAPVSASASPTPLDDLAARLDPRWTRDKDFLGEATVDPMEDDWDDRDDSVADTGPSPPIPFQDAPTVAAVGLHISNPASL